MNRLSPYLLVFLLSFLGLNFSNAQSITADTTQARSLRTKLPNNKEKAFEQLEKAAALYKKYELNALFYTTQLEVVEQRKFSSLQAKIEFAEKLLREIGQELNDTAKVYINTATALGGFYYSLGDSPKSIEYLKQADSALVKRTEPLTAIRTGVLKDIFIIYYFMGDFEQTLNYLIEAEKEGMKLKKNRVPYAEVLLYKSLVASNEVEVPQWLATANQIAKASLQKNDPLYIKFIRIEGNVYYYQRNYKQAIDQMKKIVKICQAEGAAYDLDLARAYQDIGVYYKDWKLHGANLTEEERQENIDLALDYYLKAASFYEGKKSTRAANFYRNFANIYRNQGKDLKQSLEYMHQALLALLPNESNSDPFAKIKVVGEEVVCLDLRNAFRILNFKAMYLEELYKENKDQTIEALILAVLDEMELVCQEYAARITDGAHHIVFEMREKISRRIFALTSSIYQEELPGTYYEYAFKGMEKNKNAILLSTLQSDKAFNMGNVEEAMVKKEQELKTSLSNARVQLIYAVDSNDSLQIDKKQRDILELQNKYEGFLKQLAKEAPDYHKLKYQQNIPKLKDIQAMLPDSSMIIEFLLFGNNLFVLQITKETINIRDKVNLNANLRKILGETKKPFPKQFEKFRAALTDISRFKKDAKQLYEDYSSSAYLLFQTLELDSILNNEKIKHLIIIPSERLNHIPFEALLCSPAQEGQSYKDLDYLVKHYSLSYAYSSALLYENMQERTKRKRGILGIAAAYAENAAVAENRSRKLKDLRGKLSPLPGARSEVESLESNYAGTFLFDDAGNEAAFKAACANGRYSIIHLAMHGLLNEEKPLVSSLAFTENGDSLEDNFVFVHELSQMKIQSDLVVLSACETGYGKFKYGEGVASIARSFMFAGTPSIVMTLWEVNDYSTAKIMNDFYANLYKGQAKPEALRQAKLSYISEAEDFAAHPFFWAPFIQSGDFTPVQISHKHDIYWFWGIVAGVGFLLATVLFVFWRRAKKRSKQAV